MAPRPVTPHFTPTTLTRPLRPRISASSQCYQSTKAASLDASTATKPRARLEAVINKLPRVFRPYTAKLAQAPVSHISAFLILHELTAIVPLVVLTVGFHWGGWRPDFISDAKISTYTAQFERYFRRKQWFGLTPTSPPLPHIDASKSDIEAALPPSTPKEVGKGTRIVVEVATAYAITKALLPVRIVGSVWATPWFARRVVRPVVAVFRRVRR